jgi:hypothetical protein
VETANAVVRLNLDTNALLGSFGVSKPKKLPQHCEESVEHGTPEYLAEKIRYTLGGIDLDPASSRLANRVIRARRIYTKHSNGLDKPWLGRVYVNPPGGALERKAPLRERHYGGRLYANPASLSRAAIWWAKLVQEFRRGRADEAVFMGFTLEIMRSAQNAAACQPCDYAWCVPRQRIRYDDISGKERVPTTKPPHANMIVLMWRTEETLARFAEAFASVGRCFRGYSL